MPGSKISVMQRQTVADEFPMTPSIAFPERIQGINLI